MSARDCLAERVFAALLRTYPARFRAEYGREMTQLFRDRRRMEHAGGVRFWLEVVVDVARSASAMHAESLNGTVASHPHNTGETMKPMAILTMLVGLIQAVNAMIEGMAGRSQSGDAYSLVGVALGLIAAALLVGAGVAMLRRVSHATAWAWIAAVVGLAVVVLIRLIQPWMSGFGMLLGVGFPVVLLVFLVVSRRRGTSGPMMA